MPESLVSCEGGLDLRSSSINAPKGTLSACYNFEKDQGPGYVRRLGYVRYDGRVTGPEVEDGVVFEYLNSFSTGTFTYGEQVSISAAGLPTITAICIGTVPKLRTASEALILAYPIQNFTQWADITSYPTSTVLVGLESGAQITSIISSPNLMNNDTLTITQYDFIKKNIAIDHAASVLACPGRNESPLDAIFTYANNTYAVHDCVTFAFSGGFAGFGNAAQPIEGHCLHDHATGNFLGTILSITIASGSFEQKNAVGTVIVYDYPLGQAFPAVGAQVDLFNATNTTSIVQAVFLFNGASPTAAPATGTRACMYSTYEQYVKDYAYGQNYGINRLFPPVFNLPSSPTWTRIAMNREIPYTTVGVAADPNNNCFGPSGANVYSIYEYTRLGLTQTLNALTPISSGVKVPTVAADSASPGRWVTPNNIKVSGASVASYPPIPPTSGPVTTSFLIATGFDFSAIPDGSTILGITVSYSAFVDVANSWGADTLNLVSTAFTGLVQQNKAPGTALTVAPATYTVGGPADAWGQSLTTQVIKDPSFGFQLKFRKLIAAGTSHPSTNAFTITVTYAPTSRTVYIRNPDPSVTTNQDIQCNVLHYSIDSGDFPSRTAIGALTVVFPTEASGTAAGKTRRLSAGNEIRTAPSSGSNAAAGVLLGFVSSEDYPISFPPGAALDAIPSRYEMIDANFWDVPAGRAAYIVNGVEYAVMYDGQFFVRIRTGQGPVADCPRHVASHLQVLHLGFNSGAIVWTSNVHPLSVVGALGSGGINFAEPITGMLTLNGQTLGVWTDRSTRGLQGTSPVGATSDTIGYTPTVISPSINCIEYSLVNLVGEAVWTSYRGVETIRSVNAYGDFETLPLSAASQLWLQGRLQVDLRIGSRPSRVVYAVGVRNKRQYRLYFADGYCFTLTMFDAGDTPVCTTQYISRPNTTTAIGGLNDEPTNAAVVRHIYNGTRTDGKELILACFENQNPALIPAAGVGISTGPYFPYGVRIDCGYTDDIMPFMNCWVEFNAIYSDYPTKSQQWQAMTIFANCYGGTQFNVYTRTQYDAPIIDQNLRGSKDAPPTGVRLQNLTLPVIETQAFIPVPQRIAIYDCAAEGIMMKFRIDATQFNDGVNPALVPVRICHVSFSTNGLALTRS